MIKLKKKSHNKKFKKRILRIKKQKNKNKISKNKIKIISLKVILSAVLKDKLKKILMEKK